jgi:hypothetical protein
MLERVLLSLQAVVVMCRPSLELALELWQERAETEMLKKKDAFVEAYELWRELESYSGNWGLPVVKFDLERDSFQTVKAKVATVRPKPNLGPGIGNWKEGQILVVGEKVNTEIDLLGWPFVADTGCSLWLARELELWHVDEQRLYWVNAFTRDGRETDPKFIEALKPDRIVTLGKTAELWAKRNQVARLAKHTGAEAELIHVAHPQFQKRFKSNELYPLKDALTTTLV